MNLSLIRCDLNHIDALVEISRNTFINAFEKQNNPIDFYKYLNKTLNKEALEKELSNPNISFYFLRIENTTVGYFKLNEADAQIETFNAPSIELERIYVIEEFQSKKLGEVMLKHAIQISKDKKVKFLWLGVWEKNVKAIKFYNHFGFKKFGSHDFYLGNDKQVDLLMRLNLI
jgi:ribosomal protein S18 acetylase RimI-like enzyme